MMDAWRAPQADIEALLAARHADPFAILGPHGADGGLVVRALVPQLRRPRRRGTSLGPPRSAPPASRGGRARSAAAAPRKGPAGGAEARRVNFGSPQHLPWTPLRVGPAESHYAISGADLLLDQQEVLEAALRCQNIMGRSGRALGAWREPW